MSVEVPRTHKPDFDFSSKSLLTETVKMWCARKALAGNPPQGILTESMKWIESELGKRMEHYES